MLLTAAAMASARLLVCRSAGAGRCLLLCGRSTVPHPLRPALLWQPHRPLRVAVAWRDKELHKPSSKVEVTVESLKDQLKDSEALAKAAAPAPAVEQPISPAPAVVSTVREPTAPQAVKEPAPRRSLWVRFVDELKHYGFGFKLLFINMNISRKLVWRVLNGKDLTRREQRQLVRTVSDLFRLLPFSVFIIIPFMEILLPVALKLFPNMLPSTFQTANAEEAKMKQKLKVKLETAKFLQKTLDSMALKGKGHYSDSARDFADFFKTIRSSGRQADNEQILKFSKLFEDEVTLDSLDRPLLTALCRVLEIPPFGTNNFLRFIITMKLRGLKADDRIIQREGVDAMMVEELQAACRARGMRAYGVSEGRLRSQLNQWLDLSLNEKVPPSLLLLSRALYLPEHLPAGDQLKAAISRLPESVGTATRAAIGDAEGRVDFKTRVDVVQDEQRKILEEREEQRAQKQAEAAAALKAESVKAEAEAAATVAAAAAAPPPAAAAAEELVDAAPPVVDSASPLETEVVTSRDVSEIEGALETLAATRRRPLLETEELEDIKEEMADYQEDIQDLQDIMSRGGKPPSELKETRAARGLQYSVNNLIRSLDSMINRLEAKERRLQAENGDGARKKSDEQVGIQELIQTLQHLQATPDQTKLDTISHVLAKLDDNQDGRIRVEDVYDVIELMSQENNLKLSRRQAEEIVDLLDTEKVLDLERRIEKSLLKEAEQIAAAAAAAEASDAAPTQPGSKP